MTDAQRFFITDATIVGAFIVAQVKRGPGELRYIIPDSSSGQNTPVNLWDAQLTPNQSQGRQATVPVLNGVPLIVADSAVSGCGVVGPIVAPFQNGLVLWFRTGLDISCLLLYC